MSENSTISEHNPVKARFYDYNYFKYPWHFHKEFEIIYVRTGMGKCFVGDSIVPYSAGDIILLGSNLPHYMSSDDKGKKDDDVLRTQGTIIHLEYDFMRHSMTFYPQFTKIRKLLEESAKGIRVSSGDSPIISGLLDRIPLNSGMTQIINILSLLQEITEIKNWDILCTPNYARNFSLHVDSRIAKILTYINSNYNKKIKLSDVASLAAMNPSAFCRFFKEKTGKSFVRYIQELRISYACKQLLSGDSSISRICIESGFDTLSHFNRTFKHIMGFSPTYYRTHTYK